MDLSMVAPILLTPLQIALGMLLFTYRLPPRDDPPWRPVASALAFLGASIISMSLMGSPLGVMAGFYGSQLVVFSIILSCGVVALHESRDITWWTAIFCATAGYTVQNLASGATELACVLLGHPTVSGARHAGRYLVALLCTVVIYGIAHHTVARGIRDRGLSRMQNRTMVLMAPVVMLAIIGFDVVIKWLTAAGIPLWSVLALRGFHGLACVFTLSMEYELLVTRSLEAERDTMAQVLAEHGRQYEQARGNVAAINARVHDIRHALGRLADSEGVSRDVLRDMVREVKVYDVQVRTGNEALDTALTECRLRLQKDGVSLLCVADGHAFDFMAPADVYTLFCAMLDAVAETETTSISLTAREVLGTASAHVECRGEPLSPVSLQPADAVVSRYGGTLSIAVRDGISHVNVLFPSGSASFLG